MAKHSIRPSREELAGAASRTVADVIAPGLRILFCGINPGLYTAFSGNHFAGPGNRFYPALYAGGFTPRLYRPDEKNLLLQHGLGITNVVPRASRAADELTAEEYRKGAEALNRKVRRYAPRWLAVLGIGAYRTAFARSKAQSGEQLDHQIGTTRVYVLPNPSGLNAHFSPAALGKLFAEFREYADQE
jgi:TDG/mug DNA glycosylase family protein